MPPKFNQLIYVLFFGCVIALLISINTCRNKVIDYDQSKNYLASLNDTITYLRSGIAQKPAVEVNKDLFENIVKDNESLKKQLKDAQIKAKNVHNVTQVVTTIKTDTIRITLKDSIPCNFKPIPFNVDSLYYSIGGLVSKTSIKIGKVAFPDSVTIITADKKHLFKKNEFIVSISHSNALVKTVGLTSLSVKESQAWYQNGWIKVGAGLLGGFLLFHK